MRYRIRTLQGIVKVDDYETDDLSDAIEAAKEQRELYPKGNVTINDSAIGKTAGWWPDEPVTEPPNFR